MENGGNLSSISKEKITDLEHRLARLDIVGKESEVSSLGNERQVALALSKVSPLEALVWGKDQVPSGFLLTAIN